MIIQLRYGLEDGYRYTRKEVARIFKIEDHSIQYIEKKALRKLQHPKRAHQLDGFEHLLATEGPMERAGYFYLLQDVVYANRLRERPNLFRYATRELSQDAFICWLLSWADDVNRENDGALYQTGVTFVNRLLATHEVEPPPNYWRVDVDRQVGGIDVVAQLNDDIVLIVEDKIDASEHSDQLARYLKAAQRRFTGRTIVPVYFKMGEQLCFSAVEAAGWKCFLRRMMLNVLASAYRLGARSDILNDYHERLMELDRRHWNNEVRRP